MIISNHTSTHFHTHITIDCLAGHRTGAIAINDSAAIVSYDTTSRTNIVHVFECRLIITISNRAIVAMISDDASKAIIAIYTSGIVAIVNFSLGRSVAHDTANIA
jgi:hypothetical protein